MLVPSRSEILYHKVVWGVSPFLVCRTVSPPNVREFRAHCNCDSCRSSRRRGQMEALSHPFGRSYDPPMSRYQLSRMLRNRFDVCRNAFARKNATVLLNMMVTDPDFVALCPVYEAGMSLRNHVKELVCDFSDEYRSLNGLFFEKIRVYDLRKKGFQLLSRSLRSHSIPPSLHLWSVPEVIDLWWSDSIADICAEPYTDPEKYPDFSKFGSSVERLVLGNHFSGSRTLNYDFSGSTVMSDSNGKRLKTRRSLVSTVFVAFSKKNEFW